MASTIIPVTFRVSPAMHEQLAIRGAREGLTVQAFAQRATIEALNSEHRLSIDCREILAELKELRRDYAIGTEAVLTVVGGTKASAASAEAWVKRNLNRR